MLSGRVPGPTSVRNALDEIPDRFNITTSVYVSIRALHLPKSGESMKNNNQSYLARGGSGVVHGRQQSTCIDTGRKFHD